jgi:2-phospho-L-lactate guanylyltransferase (CobY/MobA/RfbA family)
MMKKIQIRLTEENDRKLREMAARYGMSINSVASFIIGKWLDENYDLKDRILQGFADSQKEVMERVAKQVVEELFSNPEKIKELERYGLKLNF